MSHCVKVACTGLAALLFTLSGAVAASADAPEPTRVATAQSVRDVPLLTGEGNWP